MKRKSKSRLPPKVKKFVSRRRFFGTSADEHEKIWEAICSLIILVESKKHTKKQKFFAKKKLKQLIPIINDFSSQNKIIENRALTEKEQKEADKL